MRKLLSLILAAAMSLSLVSLAMAAEPDSWYAEAQSYVTEQGIMQGNENGFDPDGTVDRATIFHTFWHLQKDPEAEASTFGDVAPDDWYAGSAAWAQSVGLAEGDGSGYRGKDPVTRVQAATIFLRYADLVGTELTSGDLSTYADAAEVPSWGTDGMAAAVGSGIIAGTPEHTLDPSGTVTRAQLAVMLMRYGKLAQPEVPEVPSVTGTVREVEKYGHASLDIRIEDFNAAGFTLGDIVTVTAGSYTGDMPYFDGYYVDSGEYMVRAYPGHETIAVCINYGKFCETAGVDVGDPVTITMKEKGGAAAIQATYSLVYTDERDDYDSDEIFANFRAVVLGDIAEGKLYRSASPINNGNGRASYADKLIEAAGVKTVMNLADTDEEIAEYVAGEDFNSPYYKSLVDAGSVIALGMPVNYASDEFGEGIVKGLTFLAQHQGPYLVHCTEGKDRAGFTAALLEALMGADLDEIVEDYMLSYVNYYHIDPVADQEKYDLIANGNVMEMLRSIAGLEKGADLSGVDLAKAAEDYVLAHGMTAEDLASLKTNLAG